VTLQKQLVPISLGLSIDSKTDPKQLQGALINLQNGYVKRVGEIRKRQGYESLGKEVLGGVSLSEGVKLATFDNELALLSTNTLYSYAAEAGRWSNKGPVATASVSTVPIIANSYQQENQDVAFRNGTAVYAWEDSRGGVRASVLDQASQASLIDDVELDALGERPRCVAIGQYVFVFYHNATDGKLYACRADASNPDTFSSPVQVASDIASSGLFDVCVFGARMIVAYRTSGGDLKLSYYLQANRPGTLADGVPDPTTIAAEDPDVCITVTPGVSMNTTPTFHVAWFNSVEGVKTMGFYSNFTTYKAALVLDSDVSVDARNITAVAYENEFTTLNSLEVYYEREAADVIDHYVVRALVTVLSNTADSVAVYQRSAGLASKAYRLLGATRINVSYQSDSAFQDTLFNLSDDASRTLGGWGYSWGSFWGGVTVQAVIDAKMLPGASGGHTPKASQLPGVWAASESAVVCAVARKTRIVADNVDTYTLTGVNLLRVEHEAVNVGLPAQLGSNLHVPGGFLKSYDGKTVVEHGFHLFPETPAAASGATGSIASGTYQWVVVWEWIDAKGQIHRSAPSIPVSFTVTGPDAIDLTIPTLRYTAKKAPARTEVIASVYRTTAGGTLFYKVSSDSSPLYNDTTADTITFTDTLADASITSRPLLYTTGGTLENISPPACNVVRAFKNRLFLAGLENPNDVLFSREFVRDEGVAFSDSLRLSVNATGGGVTALATLDEKLVIFKPGSIYILTGQGPTDTGAQNDFTNPQQVSSDVGCSEPESVVETPMGVMFKAARGIYLLDRGLNVTYIGDKVERFNSLNITGAVLVPEYNHVRFTTEEGTTLVYDYLFKLWTTFTNQASVAAISWNNTFCFLRSDGDVWQESSSTYADNGSPVKTTIETSWVSLAGLQGFQRVYEAMILGEYIGQHYLKVSVAYDFEGFYRESFTINADGVTVATIYGEESPYGQGAYGGSENGVYQLECKVARQKCSAIKFLIEDYFPSSEATGGFNLSAITLVTGVKQGANKLPNSRLMTS
jgi:hypothetical protein